LRRTLQASLSEAVAAFVMDGDTPGHVVRLLTSTIPSVAEDCAACIGALCSVDCHASNRAKVVMQFTKSLCDLVSRDVAGNYCFNAFVNLILLLSKLDWSTWILHSSKIRSFQDINFQNCQ
jgi:hypothetical protein